MKKTKKEKKEMTETLYAISIGGYNHKVELIPIPKNDSPDIDRLYVTAISGFNCKKENIYLDDVDALKKLKIKRSLF